MSKSAEAFRTISEVADELEVPKHVLRFWEVKFPQIRPMKRGGGRRYYRPEDMILLRGIQRLLHAEGYTIKGVQKILREQGIDQVKVHGVDAAETASSPNAEGAKPSSKQDIKSKVQASGRIRDLPKSAKSTRSVAGRGAALPSAHYTALQHALRELEACREALTAPFHAVAGPADAAVRPARTARSAR
jgi:DNA-binding transcriptional MerR regulator